MVNANHSTVKFQRIEKKRERSSDQSRYLKSYDEHLAVVLMLFQLLGWTRSFWEPSARTEESTPSIGPEKTPSSPRPYFVFQ